MRKMWMWIKNRIRRFFCPTIEEALGQYGIGENVRCSSEELETLKKQLEEYGKQLEK